MAAWRRRLARLMVAFIALVLALSFTGCGATQQSDLPLLGKKFAIVVKSQGNQYFDAIVNAFCPLIEAQGGTLIIKEPAHPTAEAQITIINELISDNVDCIAIAANSESAIGPALQKAMAQGIAVLSFDSAVSASVRALHVNQADSQRIAQELMAAANDIAGGQGQIAIMSTTNQANNQNIWIDEMRALLEDGEYPGLTLVNIVYGEDDYDITYEKTQFLIDNYPNLSLIIAPTAAGIPAVAECITNNSMEKQIKVTGLGLPSQMAEYIGPDKVCPYMFLWDLEAVGKLTAYAAMGLVTGTISGGIGETLLAGELGEYKITEDPFGGSEIVLQEAPTRFDGTNIEQWKDVY